MSLIKLENIGVSFDNNEWKLFNVDLEIEPSSYIGLIGPNGAGKSTLLKVILGIFEPSEGRVVRKKNLNISYVPQKLGMDLKSNISVKELLLMGIDCSFWQRVRQACDTQMREALKMVDLQHDEILGSQFNHLSGGQKQRVLIARSLLSKPDLILFDEPLSGVDLPTKTKIYELLAKINAETGLTIVFVSHEIESVIKSCKQVLCLNKTIHKGCHPVDFILGESHAERVCKTDCDSSKVSIHHHHNN